MTESTDELLAYAGRLGAQGNDELLSGREIRDEQDLVATAIATLGLPGLLAAREEASSLVRSEGILFGAAAGHTWQMDPLPLVIGHDEWGVLQAGLQQRSRLLAMLLADIYGKQQLVSSGAVPAEIIWGHSGFLPQVSDTHLPANAWLTLTAADLGRSGDGWMVLDDRTGAPAGMGYAMTNRRISSRTMGELISDARIGRLRNHFAAVRAGLRELTPDPNRLSTGVLLWGGPDDETSYEQGFLATLLGYSLVEAEDLTLHDSKVWIDGPRGRSRVDVILRRIPAVNSDPLDFRSESQQGLSGLAEAARLGNVTVVNSLGSGVLENTALLPLMPELSRQLLGEELILPAVETWWCGEPAQLDHVLTNLADIVIKPNDRKQDGSTICGWELTTAERDELAARIKAAPGQWCGQDPLQVSTAPVVTPDGLQPRRVVLRCFGLQHDNRWDIMHGGLARVAPDAGTYRVGSALGYVSKDVWVLDPEERFPEPYDAPDAGPWQLSAALSVAPRVADNLYWLGRYSERVEGIVRTLSHAHDSAADHGQSPGSLEANALAVLLRAAEEHTRLELSSADVTRAQAAIRRAVLDADAPGSLAHTVAKLTDVAHRVPDIMSVDVWQVFDAMRRLLEMGSKRRDFRSVLGDVQVSALAIAGVSAESLTRDTTWVFIDAGVRVERAQRTLRLIRSALGVDRPAILESLVIDLLLAVCESTYTSRRRRASGEWPRRPVSSALSVILLDPINPRSVRFQLMRLGENLRLLDDELADETEGLIQMLEQADLPHLLSLPRPELAAFILELTDGLRRFSDHLTERHFTRRRRPTMTLAGWSDGGHQ